MLLVAWLLLVAGCYLGGMAFEACENSMSVFYCSCWKSIDLMKFENACECLATKSLLVVSRIQCVSRPHPKLPLGQGGQPEVCVCVFVCVCVCVCVFYALLTTCSITG
jgi:hypothetical protein